MWALFCKFDKKPTWLWIAVQVLLVSLILIGVTLLSTEKYWLSPVVLWLLEREQAGQSAPLPTDTGQPAIGTTPIPTSTSPTSLTTSTTSMTHSQTPFSITLPSSSKRGQPVVISWQLHDVPASASIGFFITSEALMFPRPLTLVTIPLTVASGTFTWDGERYGCDPLDTPTYCRGITTGAYTITAKVYDKKEVSLVDGDRQVPLVHDEKVLYASAEMPLLITGVPSDERIDTFKQVVANKINTEYLKEANPLALWDSTATAQEDRIKPYIKSESTFTGPDADGKFCMNFSLTAPFAGHFTVCGPDTTFYRDTADQFTATGDFEMKPGILSFAVAKQSVLDKVWMLYQGRVAFRDRPSDAEAGYTGDPEGYQQWIDAHPNADTYMAVDVNDWTYRSAGVLGQSQTTAWNGEGYWAFAVQVTKIGSAKTVPDMFNDKLIIKVDTNGKACVVHRYEYLTYTGKVLNIHTDTLLCQ